MKLNQFNCNACNFTVVKLKTHLIHAQKRQHYVALGRRRINLFGQVHQGSQLHAKLHAKFI